MTFSISGVTVVIKNIIIALISILFANFQLFTQYLYSYLITEKIWIFVFG